MCRYKELAQASIGGAREAPAKFRAGKAMDDIFAKTPLRSEASPFNNEVRMAQFFVADQIFELEGPKSEHLEQIEPLKVGHEDSLELGCRAGSLGNRVAAGRGVQWGAEKSTLAGSERSPHSSLNNTFDRSTTARSSWLSPLTWEVQIVTHCLRPYARANANPCK